MSFRRFNAISALIETCSFGINPWNSRLSRRSHCPPVVPPSAAVNEKQKIAFPFPFLFFLNPSFNGKESWVFFIIHVMIIELFFWVILRIKNKYCQNPLPLKRGLFSHKRQNVLERMQKNSDLWYFLFVKNSHFKFQGFVNIFENIIFCEYFFHRIICEVSWYFFSRFYLMKCENLIQNCTTRFWVRITTRAKRTTKWEKYSYG